MTSLIGKLLVGGLLMALCVVVHAIGLTAAFERIKHRQAETPLNFWSAVRMLIVLASWIILLHLVNIVLWGFLYAFKQAIPDYQSAMYFSAVTYTTTGYGDIVLPRPWQLVGAIEALTGLLMYGWTTGFFFAIVSQLYTRPRFRIELNAKSESTPPSGSV